MPLIAVIDSAAHDYIDPRSDTYEHGHTVARVIADLACANLTTPECGMRIRNHLALPLDLASHQFIRDLDITSRRGRQILCPA